MQSHFVRRARLALATILSAGLVLVPRLDAQKAADRSTGPERGAWGAEAGVGRFSDASVLRFQSPSWAVLVGGSFQSTNDAGTGSARVPGRTDVAIQAGIRKYHRSGLGLRPITGAGVTFGRIQGFSNSGGAYGEVGAAYLFTPHLSLGAVGVGSFSRDGDRNTISLFVPRVVAAVFF